MHLFWRIDFELIPFFNFNCSTNQSCREWLAKCAKQICFVFFPPTILPIIGLAGLPPDVQWVGMAALGPVQLEEISVREEPAELLPEPASLLRTRQVAPAGKWAPRSNSLYPPSPLCSCLLITDAEGRDKKGNRRCLSSALRPPSSASFSSLTLLCGAGAALAVVLLVFMSAVVCSRLRGPTGHTVCT